MTHEAIQQVSGGLSLAYSHFKIFPRGIPAPEWLNAGKLGQQVLDPQRFDISNGF